MSIQSNFPAIKPTLLLDFANTKQLDPRVTFSRASTATYYGTQTAKAEENLLLQSQDFNTTWAALNTSTTANTSVAPDGTTTADTLTDNTTAGTHVLNQSPAFIVGMIYTMSVFMKAGTNNFGVLTLTNATTAENGISAVVDLSAGTISQTDSGTSATFTSSSITSVGNGWYRVVITGSSVAGFNRAEVALAPAGTGNTFSSSQRISYTGTGTSILLWGAQLEQRSAVTAYTATTTQTITNYIPVLQTAASGVARFDHNPTTFESLGLLIEEQRTNLLTYSEQFDNAAWTKTNATITSNTIVAPDGTLTSDKLVEDIATSTHKITTASVSITSGTAYTLSLFVKSAERTAFTFRRSGAAGASASFNLTTLTTTGIAGSPTMTIVPVGNGWYRCTMSWTASATAGLTIAIELDNPAGTTTYTGDGYSGIFIWGAQLEAGAFATSYIQTVASQVTRSVDSVNMTGTNFSSWYNQAQGTLFGEAATYDVSAARISFAVTDGTTSNRIQIGHGLNPKGFIGTGGATQMTQSVASVVFTNNTFSKMSLSYANNSGNVAANGTLGTLDTAITLPLVDQLRIGVISGTTGTINGTIKKLAYYPLASTSAQLQGLTS